MKASNRPATAKKKTKTGNRPTTPQQQRRVGELLAPPARLFSAQIASVAAPVRGCLQWHFSRAVGVERPSRCIASQLPPLSPARSRGTSRRTFVGTSIVALAKRHGADVVLFPELSLTGYEPTLAAQCAASAGRPRSAPLKELADNSSVVILAGCPIRSASERPFIGMLIFQPGRPTAVYRKRFVHSSEEPYFVASDDTVVFPVRDMAIGAAICADIKNPIHSADAARLGGKSTPQE